MVACHVLPLWNVNKYPKASNKIIHTVVQPLPPHHVAMHTLLILYAVKISH